jgi:glucose-1-phosphate thymidylyltransferase
MVDMKIVIPMAGAGKRLAQLTRHKPKALVRIAEKRLLDHVLNIFQSLEETYELEYIFVIGYLGEQIKKHMQEVHPDKKVVYYTQEQLLGQSHALYLAKDSITGPMLLTYCDTLNEIDFSFLSAGKVDGVAFVKEVDDPRRHGIAMTDIDNLITRLIEKPNTREHKLALTGFYYFSEGRDLIKAIEIQLERDRSLNNEYYLADAINILVENGARIRTEKALQWLDAGTPEAIMDTNAYLLRRYSGPHNEIAERQANILIPPIFVHERAHVRNSIIGPNVSIGADCTIEQSIIKDSIIDDDTAITEAIVANSLIGRGCSISGKTSSMIMADYDTKRLE